MTTPKPDQVALLAPQPFKERLASNPAGTSIFLAGSIEMGKAEEWQPWLTNRIFNEFTFSTETDRNSSITVLNPRRTDWDSTWTQSITSPPFREQVVWELDAQDAADVIAMYFDPATKAPISLMELGHYASSGKMVVCCPEGFWRRGNVEVICERYSVPLVGSKEEWAGVVVEVLRRKAEEKRARQGVEEVKGRYLVKA